MMAMITNNPPLITAAVLSLPSNDFLLPYSLAPDIPPIPNPMPHLGDINRTDQTKTSPANIIKMIKNVRMVFYKKVNKYCPSTIQISQENANRS